MKGIFYPNTIAVVGASNSPHNLAKNIFTNLIEFNFQGIIYGVGVKGGVISGHRIYKSISDVPDQIDLAVILTPAKTIPQILEECGEKGVKHLVIESAGFREHGEEGKKLEEQLLAITEKYKMKFVGPNCIGVINMENGLSLPFLTMNNVFHKGNISIVSQSGGVGISYLNILASEGIGVNKFVSVGNKISIDENDMIEYLEQDQGTEIICVYLEGISNGRRLIEVARKSLKPILIQKSNIGQLGKSIASSHTGSLSSDDKVVDAAFNQFGILRIRDTNLLSSVIKALKLPKMQGNRLAIISRSGGHAVIAADSCEMFGFSLAALPEALLAEIEAHSRASVIKLTNPLDLGDLFDFDMYVNILEMALKEKDIDGIVFLHTYLSGTEQETSHALFKKIGELTCQYNKPVAICVSTDEEELSRLKKYMPYPIFDDPEETIRALEIAKDIQSTIEYRTRPLEMERFGVDSKKARQIINENRGKQLLLSDALDLLKCYGLKTVESRLVHSVEEAQKVALEIGFPVAIKVVSTAISHKTDIGGVELNLQTQEGVEKAISNMNQKIKQRMPEAAIDGYLVQSMVSGGKELILGAKCDSQFGHAILLGLGGIFVEILKQAVIRIAPLTRRDIAEMFKELKGVEILKGARGQAPFDVKAIEEALLRLSQLVMDCPEIKELDINPLKVFYQGEGTLALDTRILLS